MEKLEVLYLAPYYLQAFFFLIGTFSWLISEIIFETRLPFWTDLWGWSLVLTNLFALPLMNAVGMFLAITDGGPGRSTEVLSLHMYREAIQFFHFGYGAALSVVLFGLNAILAVVYTRALETESALAA